MKQELLCKNKKLIFKCLMVVILILIEVVTIYFWRDYVQELANQHYDYYVNIAIVNFVIAGILSIYVLIMTLSYAIRKCLKEHLFKLFIIVTVIVWCLFIIIVSMTTTCKACGSLG